MFPRIWKMAFSCRGRSSERAAGRRRRPPQGLCGARGRGARQGVAGARRRGRRDAPCRRRRARPGAWARGDRLRLRDDGDARRRHRPRRAGGAEGRSDRPCARHRDGRSPTGGRSRRRRCGRTSTPTGGTPRWRSGAISPPTRCGAISPSTRCRSERMGAFTTSSAGSTISPPAACASSARQGAGCARTSCASCGSSGSPRPTRRGRSMRQGLRRALPSAPGLAGLSRERVRAELLKLLAAPRAGEVVGEAAEVGLLFDALGGARLSRAAEEADRGRGGAARAARTRCSVWRRLRCASGRTPSGCAAALRLSNARERCACWR